MAVFSPQGNVGFGMNTPLAAFSWAPWIVPIITTIVSSFLFRRSQPKQPEIKALPPTETIITTEPKFRHPDAWAEPYLQWITRGGTQAIQNISGKGGLLGF